MKTRGRPRIKESDKVQYQRIAIYKHTYDKLHKMSKDDNKNLVDVVDGLIN